MIFTNSKIRKKKFQLSGADEDSLNGIYSPAYQIMGLEEAYTFDIDKLTVGVDMATPQCYITGGIWSEVKVNNVVQLNDHRKVRN